MASSVRPPSAGLRVAGHRRPRAAISASTGKSVQYLTWGKEEVAKMDYHLVNLDTMLVVPGRIIETSTSPLACRTQFTQSVRDARHLFLNWGAGAIVPTGSPGDLSRYAGAMPMLHRAVFYGDHVRSLQRLGDLMGFHVIEEDRATWPE